MLFFDGSTVGMATTQDKWKQISLFFTVLDNIQKHWRERGGGRREGLLEIKRVHARVYVLVGLGGSG